MSSKKHNLTSNLLIHYSAKRARKDARDRQRLIDKAKRYEENPALLKSDLRRGGKSYLKVEADQLSAEVDQERIDANAFFDGYYGISFSNSERTAEEVLAIHHSLWQIEESFRISKSLFEAPVFVKLLFQKFPKKIVINYPAPGTSSRTLGYLCTKADQLIVPETCYHGRTVQGGIPMTVTIADRLAFVRGVLF